jgi:dihydrofolate reductase
MDGAFDAYNAERLRAADALLLGRTTYDGFNRFWPSVADDPVASPTNREISRLDNALDEVVVSDSLTPDETEPWRETTRIIGRGDAHDQLAEMKRQPGEDILVFGNRTLWNDLLAHGLVGELHLMIGAVVVGSGTLAIAGQPAVSLRLVDPRRWEGSENVLVRYEVVLGGQRERDKPALGMGDDTTTASGAVRLRPASWSRTRYFYRFGCRKRARAIP